MNRRALREQVFKLLFRVEFNSKEEMEEQCRLFLEHEDMEISEKDADYIVEKYFPDVREGESNRIMNNRIYSPIWVKTEGKIGLRPEYPPIPDGTRNISLTSIAGQWHNLGYSKEEIYRELLYVNSIACHPPLDVGEIQCITNSVTRYKR